MSLIELVNKQAVSAEAQPSRYGWRDAALRLLIVLLFCQLWFDVGGVTLRSEDLLLLLLLAVAIWPVLFTLRWDYIETQLNRPIISVCAVLVVGIIVTQLRPYSGVIQKDAVINGLRLIFMLLLFFFVLHHPLSAEKKSALLLQTVIRFSFVTTAVCLLQIAYWAGRLPFQLPGSLITFANGSSTGFGKEIFGLYLGNTGTHVWSALLAMQLLAVWLFGRQQPHIRTRVFWYGYAAVLFMILLRMSVRNSILGVLAAILFGLIFFAKQQNLRVVLLIRAVLILSVVALLFGAVALLYPDSPAVIRVFETIPRYENGSWVISRRSNLFGRIEAYSIALRIFAKFPVFGSGFWGYTPWQLQMRQFSNSAHSHNAFLQVLAELGLVGSIFWGWLLIRIGRFLRTAKPSVPATTHEEIVWQLGVTSLVFCFFTAFFAIPLFQTQQLGWLMVLLGLIASFQTERIASGFGDGDA